MFKFESLDWHGSSESESVFNSNQQQWDFNCAFTEGDAVFARIRSTLSDQSVKIDNIVNVFAKNTWNLCLLPMSFIVSRELGYPRNRLVVFPDSSILLGVYKLTEVICEAVCRAV